MVKNIINCLQIIKLPIINIFNSLLSYVHNKMCTLETVTRSKETQYSRNIRDEDYFTK